MQHILGNSNKETGNRFRALKSFFLFTVIASIVVTTDRLKKF